VKSYLITDPSLYGDDARTLSDRLEKVLQKHTVDFFCFRDKTTPLYRQLSETVIQKVRENSDAKILLHGDYNLAHTLGVNGVHLASTQFDSLKSAKELGLYVIISTHTHDEVEKAQKMGADAVTYSPIYESPNKGNPKGLEDLKLIVDKIRIPIFALGGILTQEQINEVEAAGAYGFASIRYFM
jgi:thiamine-phosphate pyrophosphorylase